MDPQFLGPLVPIVAIIAFAAVKIARLREARPELPPVDVTARIDALEDGLQNVRQELAETQERLDFTERMLIKVREDRQIGN